MLCIACAIASASILLIAAAGVWLGVAICCEFGVEALSGVVLVVLVVLVVVIPGCAVVWPDGLVAS